MKISVEYASPRHPDIKKLLLASHQLMRDLYPEETNSYLSIDELCSSDVHFLGARQNDKYCGCGALEVKPDVIATGCPFCNTMMTDGVKYFEKENEIEVKDIAELIANAADL